MRRALEIACAAVAAVLVALFVVVDDDHDIVVMAGWMASFLAAGVPLVMANLRAAAMPAELRPQRFVVRSQGFVAPYEHDLRYARGVVLLALAGFVGLGLHNWPMLFILPAFTQMLLAASRSARHSVTLTTAGVLLRDAQLAAPRLHAWGEPLEVPRNLAVNPWFVSAAIKWYADHPDERPAIGTPEGHNRLREALGAKDPVSPTRPSLPRNLVFASWLTYIGVALGVLAGVRDVALTVAFLPALERSYPADLFDGASFILLQSVGEFLIAIVAGLLAIVMLHAVRRGRNERARVTLVLLAGAAIAIWFPKPLDGNTLRYAEIDHRTGVLILAGWHAVRLVISVIGLAAFLLLMSKPVQEFSRPPVMTGPYRNPVRG